MGKGKDLGGREPPLERGGSLPPNLPLSPRTSPKSTRLYMAKSCFALYGTGALGGSFLFRAGGDFFESAAVALVLWVGCIWSVCLLQVQIDPPSSVAYATNCLQFSSPKGKPFARFLSYYATKDEESIYTRPHPSPTVTPSPSKGKASVGSASYIKSASNFIFCKINSPEHIFPKKQIQMRTLRTKAFPFEGEGGAAGDG